MDLIVCSVYITVFYLFFKILIYIISIFCKLLYGLCFRNKHIIQYNTNTIFDSGIKTFV